MAARTAVIDEIEKSRHCQSMYTGLLQLYIKYQFLNTNNQYELGKNPLKLRVIMISLIHHKW